MGLVGNLLMGVVLLRNSLNTNFHQTIVALTVVNLLFVVMIVVDSFHPDLNLENQLYIRLFPYLWHPVKAILLCCETYLVMSITMERYLAVKLPVRLHMVNLHHHSHFRHFATFTNTDPHEDLADLVVDLAQLIVERNTICNAMLADSDTLRDFYISNHCFFYMKCIYIS